MARINAGSASRLEPAIPAGLPINEGEDATGSEGRIASHGLQIVTACDFPDLRRHLAAWDELAWHAPQNIPTLLPGWVDAVLRHKLRDGERWLCSFAYMGSKLIGVLPVITRPHPVLGQRWPIVQTPYDPHTPSGDVPLAHTHAEVALKGLLDEIRRQVPTHLEIDLKAVRRSSPVWQAIGGEIAGYIVGTGLRSRYSFLDVAGEFSDYSACLGQVRSDLRRCRKRLEKRGAVSIEVLTDPHAAEEFLAEFVELEASGWKGRYGTAMSSSQEAVDFYRTLVRNLAQQGRVEWHIIRVDGQLVAAEMCIRCGGALAQLKQAYNEDFAECKPGYLLRGELIKDIFSRHDVTEFNPMSNAEAHRRWHMPLDDYTDIHLIRRRPIPLMLQLPCLAARFTYQEYIRTRVPGWVKRGYTRLRSRTNLAASVA